MIERKNNLNLQYNNTAHSSKSNSTKSSKLPVFRSAVSNGQNTSGMKILLIGIIALLIFSLAAAPASATAWDGTTLNWSWYDEDTYGSTNSYYIYDEGSLAALSDKVGYNITRKNFSGKTINLMNDLDLNRKAWNAIGKYISVYDKRPFNGIFDGNNKTISNLYINDESADYQGLFGYADNATIKNLKLTGVKVTGRNSVGGLVGSYYSGSGVYDQGGKIENCYAAGVVTGMDSVGGLVGGYGGNAYSSITNSYATVAVTGNQYVGGLVGEIVGDTNSITKCYATGTVRVNDDDSDQRIGGLVGNNNEATIEYCYATGTVAGTGSRVGGLVGCSGSGKITQCYATGAVIGTDDVGGLVGHDYGNKITNSTALNPSVSGSSNVGRVVGNNNGGTITYCYAWDNMTGNFGTSSGVTDKNGLSIDSSEIWNIAVNQGVWASAHFDTNIWDLNPSNEYYKLPVLKGSNGDIRADTVSDAIFLKAGLSDFWVNGNGDVNTPYGINNVYQLRALAQLTNANNTNYNDKNYKLTGNLNLANYKTGASWTPIGTDSNPFNGIFDGNNKTISNLYINKPSIDNQGLFGVTCDATIINLGLTGVNITGSTCVGGLVGKNEAKSGTAEITNCYVSGKISGNHGVGGLLGINMVVNSGNVLIRNSYATATVTGDYVAGGLVGRNVGTIKYCYATGAVTGTLEISGLVGENYGGKITNCYATGVVTGTGIDPEIIGGLVGANVDGKITNCYAVGAVTGANNVGGLLGVNMVYSGTHALINNSVALNPSVSGITNVSRVVGYNVSGTISDNYAWNGMKVNDTFVQGGAHDNVNGENAESVDVWDNAVAYSYLIPNFDTYWRLSTNEKYKLPILIWQSDDSAASFDAEYLKPLVVTFDPKDGIPAPVNQNITKGFNAVEPTAPTKTDNTFAGWYKDSALTTAYAFDTPVTEDITLYAKWTPAVTPTSNPAKPSSGGSTDTGSGNYKIYERFSTDGGIILFGTSPYIKSVELPKGTYGNVVLTLNSENNWLKDLTSEYLFDIEVANMADDTAKINFTLSKDKLDKLGIDYTNICVYHEIDGAWVKLKTEFTVGEDGYIYYTSYTDSFSPFKIVFEENGAAEVSQPAVTPVKTQTAEPVSTYVEPTKTAVPTAEPTNSPVGLVGLGLGLLGAALVLRRK